MANYCKKSRNTQQPTIHHLIKNRNALERWHGKEARLVLGAVEEAIKSTEPGKLVRQAISIKEHGISFSDIYNNHFSVRGFDSVYLVGAGKAAASMSEALYQKLKHRIKEGAINVPRGITVDLPECISVTHASHPVPDMASVKGAKKIINTMQDANENDLIIFLLSGGGSALLSLPAEGILLSDKRQVTKALLSSGASIQEINTVRKHLSAVKGGQLARNAKCRMVTLVLSDVVGDELSVIASGPTFPDPTTYADSLAIVKKYGIRNSKISRHLAKGVEGDFKDTPKPEDPIFSKVRNILIGNNKIACESATRYLAQKLDNVNYLGSGFCGDAKAFGKFIAASLDAQNSKTIEDDYDNKNSTDSSINPKINPALTFALVAGGETTVKLDKAQGKGGRNQEAALSCAMAIKNPEGIVAAFVGTDGIDGNSDAAGSIVSERSKQNAKRIDAEKYLLAHDSYHALKKMKSLIFTGYTGTNVNDITIALKVFKGNSKVQER